MIDELDTRTLGRERIRRAQAAMVDARLDGLFLATGTNLLYLSGYPGIEPTLARPFFLIVPRAGEPILVVHAGRLAEARRFGWVDDVRPYAELSYAPLAVLAQAFSDAGLSRARIGAELGFEQRLGVSVMEFERIKAAESKASFVDAADMLWALRAIKAPWEVDAIRRACQITGTAYDIAFTEAREGRLDRVASRRLETAMVDGGGRDPWVMVASGAGNYSLSTGVPMDRALEPGDMLWFDAGCRVTGFWSDFSRAGVVGGASPSQLETHRAIVELTARGVAMVRPGIPVAEIAATVDAGIQSIGVPVIARTSDLAGRVGHGIGYDMTEPPHVSAHDSTVLAAGMVISIEPGVATDDGLFHAEENVVVTHDGHELLSTCDPGLRAIALRGRTG